MLSVAKELEHRQLVGVGDALDSSALLPVRSISSATAGFPKFQMVMARI